MNKLAVNLEVGDRVVMADGSINTISSIAFSVNASNKERSYLVAIIAWFEGGVTSIPHETACIIDEEEQ